MFKDGMCGNKLMGWLQYNRTLSVPAWPLVAHSQLTAHIFSLAVVTEVSVKNQYDQIMGAARRQIIQLQQIELFQAQTVCMHALVWFYPPRKC